MSYIASSLVLPQIEHWTSPEDANRVGRIWLDTVANVRIHGTTRERPSDRLPREQLVPLTSVRPYDVTWTEPRHVHKDCHFSWQGNRYSVPWQHGSSAVLVRRYPQGTLEVERDGTAIATHRERPAGRGETITLPEHVAGLWRKTLGRQHNHTPPPDVARVPTLALAVEQRDLATYQRFLEEVAV